MTAHSVEQTQSNSHQSNTHQLNTPAETAQPEGPWIDITIMAVMAILAFGFGALIGWLILSSFVHHVALQFGWDYLASNAAWLTPLAAGSLNAVGSLFKNLSQSRKHDRRKQLGKKIGFELKSDLDVETSDAIDSLFGGNVFHISNALQRNFGTAQMVVCDVQVASSRESRQNINTIHAVVYLEDPEINLPRFQLSPSSQMGRWISNLLGFKRLEFSDDEMFSRNYDLNGTPGELVQDFFDDELRGYLAQNSQWQIHASGHRVLLWQPGGRNDAEHGAQYVDEATLVYSQLRSRSLAWTPPPVSESGSASVAPPHPVLALSSCVRVTAKDVQALLSTPPPRYKLPRSIQSQKFGFPIVGVVGTMFTIGGAVFASAVFIDAIEVQAGQEWGVGLIGALFLSMGLSMVIGAIYWRWYWRRLLNHGLSAVATIKEVVRTETKINNQRLYWVTAQFLSELGQTESRMAVYGMGGETAQKALAENQTLHVLYARKNPRQAMLAEGLIDG